MTTTVISASVGAVVASVVALLFKVLFKKIDTIHVLVNSNLTAVSNALAKQVADNMLLTSENAMLKGEPGSTHDLPTEQ